MDFYKKQEGGLRIKSQFNQKSEGDRPLISIITPVLNMEDTIERTIQGVLSQTYDNIEYIIIDAQSTDKTLEIIKKYDDRISYWISELDDGISDAFNKGISLARGELVGIINGDDAYELYTVQKVVDVYNKDKSLGVIHGEMRLFQNNKPLFVLPCPLNLGKIWVRMIFNHPTCFVARRCYEQLGGFDTGFKISMDYELMVRFYINKVKFYYINEVLTNMSLDGASYRYELQGMKESIKIHQRYGYSKYFVQFWICLSMSYLKRLVRTRLGWNNSFFSLIRKIFRKSY